MKIRNMSRIRLPFRAGIIKVALDIEAPSAEIWVQWMQMRYFLAPACRL